MKRALLLIFLFISTITFAQTEVWNYHDTLPDFYDRSEGLATDSLGDSYYVRVPKFSASLIDTLVKVNADGTQGWKKTFPYSPNRVKVDPSGNVILAFNDGSINVRKYSNGGQLLWSYSDSSYANYSTLPIDIDENGNIYISTSRSNPSASRVVKLSPVGAVLYQAIVPDAKGIYCNPHGGVFVLNEPFRNSDFKSIAYVSPSGTVSQNYPAGEIPNWSYVYPGGVNNAGRFFTAVSTNNRKRIMATDAVGDTGTFWIDTLNVVYMVSNITFDDANNVYLTCTTMDSFNIMGGLTIKLDTAGNEKWKQPFNPVHPTYFVDARVAGGKFITTGNANEVFFVNLQDTATGTVVNSITTSPFCRGNGYLTTDKFGHLFVHQSYPDTVNCSFFTGKSSVITKYCLDTCITPPMPYTISGIVYIDSTMNCAKDSAEKARPYHLVELTPGPEYKVTDANGFYSFNKPAGTYYIKHFPTIGWVGNCIADTVVLTPQDTTEENVDLGAYIVDTVQDLQVSIGAMQTARVGGFYHVQARYTSKLPYVTDATLTLQLDSIFTPQNISPAPDNVTGNTLTWYLNGLTLAASGQVSFWSDVAPLFNQPFMVTGAISGTHTELWPDDNTDTVRGITVSSFDPNVKEVNQPDSILATDTFMRYTIHFQNTGNDTALSIFIIDTLDADLRLTTIQTEQASHAFTWSVIDSNIIRWDFANINLPDSNVNEQLSHGFVKYNIMMKDGLPAGRQITNDADIYFDLNAPVQTNTVVNTIVAPCLVATSAIMGPDTVFLPGTGIFSVSGSPGSTFQWWSNHGTGTGNTNTLNISWPLGDGIDTIYVVETDVNGCTGDTVSKEVYYFDVTGIGAISLAEIQFYPNPATDVVHLVLPANTQQLQLYLQDISGRSLSKYILNDREFILPVSDLPSGVYVIRILSSQVNLTKRFVKQ